MVLPSSPGVYWFLDPNDKVLYVGKAKNLNLRLRSYSRLNQLLPKTIQLVQTASQVKYQILDSELTALLIEAELIRLHQPKYNILLKDDKSPLYIVITKADFPQVLVVRRSELLHYRLNRRIFGPFQSSRQLKTILNLARHLFPYCNASLSDRKRHKACFYYHLHLCPGACIGQISAINYQKQIKHLELFLSGKHRAITKQLTKKLTQFSREQAYEQAQLVKQQIESINYAVTHYRINQQTYQLPQLTQDLTTHQLVGLKALLYQHGLSLTNLHRIEVYDVANISGQSAAVSMVVATDGAIDKSQYRHFAIRELNSPNDVAMLQQALRRRQRHPEWGIPDLIIVDGGKPQVNGVTKVMIWPTKVLGLAKHPDRLILNTKAIRLDPGAAGSQLVIQLRDEAHRFSRRLFHKLHLQQLLPSASLKT